MVSLFAKWSQKSEIKKSTTNIHLPTKPNPFEYNALQCKRNRPLVMLRHDPVERSHIFQQWTHSVGPTTLRRKMDTLEQQLSCGNAGFAFFNFAQRQMRDFWAFTQKQNQNMISKIPFTTRWPTPWMPMVATLQRFPTKAPPSSQRWKRINHPKPNSIKNAPCVQVKPYVPPAAATA